MATNHPIDTGHLFKDYTGQQFGLWTILRYVGLDRRHNRLWVCRCSCEAKTEQVMNVTRVVNGHSGSCGCENRRVTAIRSWKHGKCFVAEYRAWRGAKDRCRSRSNRQFKNYGGRGLKICDRWFDSFETFLSDMGYKPSPGLSIDRIDNSLGYLCGKCPDCVAAGQECNCRWADDFVQAGNRRNSRLLTHDGMSLSISEWARRVGLATATLTQRIKVGWPVSVALTTPARRHR